MAVEFWLPIVRTLLYLADGLLDSMGRVVRLVLGSILLFGAVRAAAYFVYAAGRLTAPLETFHLEAKMVLLAQRVGGGSPYPDWQACPHVANFFGPAYFVLVGLLGRLAGADIDQLFVIGRGVTFTSALLTTLGLAWFLYRRYWSPRGLGWRSAQPGIAGDDRLLGHGTTPT